VRLRQFGRFTRATGEDLGPKSGDCRCQIEKNGGKKAGKESLVFFGKTHKISIRGVLGRVAYLSRVERWRCIDWSESERE